jgi:hypothetical protein
MRKLLYLVTVLCFAAPGFSNPEPPPQSKEEFLRSLSSPAVTAPEPSQGFSASGLDLLPSKTSAACNDGAACTSDLQCSPGACASGYCFCGCITNWPCGYNYNNCGLDGYCLRGQCFCM